MGSWTAEGFVLNREQANHYSLVSSTHPHKISGSYPQNQIYKLYLSSSFKRKSREFEGKTNEVSGFGVGGFWLILVLGQEREELNCICERVTFCRVRRRNFTLSGLRWQTDFLGLIRFPKACQILRVDF